MSLEQQLSRLEPLQHQRPGSGFIMGADIGRVTMTIEEMLLEKLRSLPPEKQKKVLDFNQMEAQRRLSAAWKESGKTSTSTSPKKTSPKRAAKCGATSRETSRYERGVR